MPGIGIVLGLSIIFILIELLVFLGRRLLGMRVSFFRTLITGFLGLATGFAITISTWGATQWGREAWKSGDVNGLFPLSIFFFALLSTMAYLVLTEFLAQPDSLIRIQSRLVKRPHPLRALSLKISRISRYIQISMITARHGLSSYLSGAPQATQDTMSSSRLARSLRNTLQDCGGIFVKMGQVLSTRQDLLPPDLINELSGLQDTVPPAPYEKIRALLKEELGEHPEKIFATFDPEPIAAASIAQVYHTQLHSGEQVIVKVQRPGIRMLVERDIDIMLRLSETIERRTLWGKQLQVIKLAEGFANALREELDFQVEGRNMLSLSTALKNHPEITVPTLQRHLSTSRVVVMEHLDGVNLRYADQLIDELELDRDALARSLLDCFLHQILRSGVFHGDPHPGNIMLLRTGKVALIDLGSVGRLDPLQQAALRSMLFALQNNDGRLLSQAILDIAEVSDDLDEERFERSLAQFLVQHLAENMLLDAQVMTHLFLLLQKFEIAFPPVVAGVFRSMATLEGTLRGMSPDFSLVDEARALAPRYLTEEMKPSSLSHTLLSEALTLLPIVRRFPRRLDRIAAPLERGKLTTNSRLFSNQEDNAFVRSLISNMILAFLGATLGVIGTLLITLPSVGATIVQGLTVLQGIGYMSLVMSAIFIMRVLVTVVHDQTRYRS
jgi:ubiquinone biosynthesis protein